MLGGSRDVPAGKSAVRLHLSAVYDKNKWVLLVLTMVGLSLTLGVQGFIRYNGTGLLDSLYNTLRLFTLNIDFQAGKKIPLPLEVARWLAPAATGVTIYKAIQSILGYTNMLFTAARGRHFIICGIDRGAGGLAEEIKYKGFRVIIIADSTDGLEARQLRKKGIPIIAGDPADADMLERAGVYNCSHLLCLDRDDSRNTSVVTNLYRTALLRKRKGNSPITCHVHISDPQMTALFEEYEKNSEYKQAVETHLFNCYENSAKMLFNAHPLYENINIRKGGGQIHLLIIGFGLSGENVLLEAARRGHFPEQKKIRVTVADNKINDKERSFMRRYPYIREALARPVIFCDLDDLLARSSNQLTDYSSVVICLEDDRKNLSTGMRLATLVDNANIHVQVENDSALSSFIDANNEGMKNLFCFGSSHRLLGYDVVIDEELDLLAKTCHVKYGRGKWQDLPIFKRNSNRAQAEHIDTKLHVLGLSKVRKSAVSGEQTLCDRDHYMKLLSELDEDELAIMEHERWNAFHFINGWQKGVADQSQDPKNRLHPCLVSWHELDMVTEAHRKVGINNDNYKDYDRSHVLNIPDILESAGYLICIDKTGNRGGVDGARQRSHGTAGQSGAC
ncbi:MAG: NAD-binding protein [Nitrospiraceae bacterium]|nr:NAD-binding protein [Nitrospiraceae bacterium]